jgi:hypothetical protein
MIILDIINNIDDIDSSTYIEIILLNKNNYPDDNPFNFSSKNNKKKIIVKVIEFLGNGSFGCVYKIEYKNNFYAIKLNSNEIPKKLCERFDSLQKNQKIKKYLIKTFCCGNLNSDKYKYYSIMEFGGYTLKIKNCIYDKHILHFIIFQLVYIICNIIKYKILLTDFKLGNLTIDSNHNIKMIDLYIYCDDYDTCKNCKIIKTYTPIEIQKYSSIFEKNNSSYNYTYICLPFVFCLIDLLCKYNTLLYVEKLAKKYNIYKIEVKEIVNLLQISSFFYNSGINTDNNKNNDEKFSFENNKNISSYVKMMIGRYPFIKESGFYEFFLNSITVKEEYSDFIPNSVLMLLVNDCINLDSNKRYIDLMLELVKITKPKKKVEKKERNNEDNKQKIYGVSDYYKYEK